MTSTDRRPPRIEKTKTNEDHYPFVLANWVRSSATLAYEDGLLGGEIIYTHDVGGSDWHVSIESAHRTKWQAEAWNREQNTEETIATGEFVEVVNAALEAMGTEAVPPSDD